MSLDPNRCIACGAPLELEMERDEGLCSDCLCEAAGCTNGEPLRFVPNNPITRAEIDGALPRRLSA